MKDTIKTKGLKLRMALKKFSTQRTSINEKQYCKRYAYMIPINPKSIAVIKNKKTAGSQRPFVLNFLCKITGKLLLR